MPQALVRSLGGLPALAGTVLLVAGSPVVAGSYADRFDALNDACARAEIAGIIANCLRGHDDSFGQILDGVYRDALRSAADKEKLRASQRAWLQYQKTTCRAARSQSEADGPGFAAAAEARCLLRTTLVRIDELLPQ